MVVFGNAHFVLAYVKRPQPDLPLLYTWMLGEHFGQRVSLVTACKYDIPNRNL